MDSNAFSWPSKQCSKSDISGISKRFYGCVVFEGTLFGGLKDTQKENHLCGFPSTPIWGIRPIHSSGHLSRAIRNAQGSGALLHSFGRRKVPLVKQATATLLRPLIAAWPASLGKFWPQLVPLWRARWLWVKTNGTILGRCTSHFRTYCSGNWDVHWGETGILTHGQVNLCGCCITDRGLQGLLRCGKAGRVAAERACRQAGHGSESKSYPQ